MLPRVGDQLLLPVNPWFMWFTLLMAFSLNLLPFGRTPSIPDFMALALVFWNVHQPRRVGLGAAFVFGLLMDVHQGALLGQHALAYTLVSYAAIAIHRRMLWFSVFTQAVHVLPLLALGHLVTLLIRLMVGDVLPGWGLLAAPLFEALLWPVVSLVLLAPQRRPPDPDKNRPL
jgi:rod shape-determining protein MreD